MRDTAHQEGIRTSSTGLYKDVRINEISVETMIIVSPTVCQLTSLYTKSATVEAMLFYTLQQGMAGMLTAVPQAVSLMDMAGAALSFATRSINCTNSKHIYHLL